MPRYTVEFEDGSTHQGEYANGDLAKAAAKKEARDKTGAMSRVDPKVKVARVSTDEDLAREKGRS
jgi:hypothetical protein